MRALAPRVRLWVFRHVGPSGAHVDDATQEALIQLAEALPHFEGRSKLVTYAHRIAVRVAVRHARKARRDPPVELVAINDARTPEALAMHRESLRRLYGALDRLSPKLRTAYVLCDVERLSHEEAAEVEEVGLFTLRARLKRARVQLRALLRDDPYFAPLFGGGDS